MSTKWLCNLLTTFGAAIVCVASGTPQAAEITAMSTQATKAVFIALAPRFEDATQHKVSPVWVGGIMQRIKEGEIVDLVILPSTQIDELIKLGKLAPGSRVDLARTGVGVAVRAGAPKPDISSGDALRRALLAANSIAISSGSSAVYMIGLFQRMGIADEIKPRIKQIAPGLAVGDALARGEAELGFQQVSELLPLGGITYVGPLPADIQNYTSYSGGIHTAAKSPEAAMALLKFLKSPASRSAIVNSGMEPIIE